MKKIAKLLVITLLAAVVAVAVFAAVACNSKDKHEHVDYVSQLQLDFSTDTKKQEVTVKLFIDGDTTHFDPVEDSKLTPGNKGDFKDTQGYIKARYLAINTPESTGQVEEWGKAASNFTRSKLESAESIIVESNVNYWDIDSTGERYLLWVWYKPADSTEYRNLNVEILQEGLAFASRTSEGIYGEIAQKALDQAQIEKLHLYSGEKDPDFYYGGIKYVSLKELRCFPEDYNGVKISVKGTVIGRYNNSAYVEAYDADTGLYFGMPVYYGFGATEMLLKTLSIGNKVEVVGTFSVSDTFGNQISGLTPLDGFNKNDPDVCKVLEPNVQPAFTKLEAPEKLNSTSTVEVVTDREDENGNLIKVKMLYSEAIDSTSVTVENLYVKSAYTTDNDGKSDGAMTLYCETADHKEVQVRTDVLKNAQGDLVLQSEFVGKTISIKGVVEKYTNKGKTTYQIKVYRYDYITVLDAE